MNSTATPIRIGVIGLGLIGELMVDSFVAHPETTVTAVCDASPERAQAVSAKLGNIASYTDYKDLIQSADIDLLYIAVPPALHHEITLYALQAGKHIFCEKPLANSLEEAQELVAAAEKAGVITAMNFPLNYSPAIAKFSSLLSEGYLGDLRRIELTMHFPQWPREFQKKGWVASRAQGGFVLEQGIHFYQLIGLLFGRIDRVQSRLELPADETACETGILAQMELEDGTPVLLNGLSGVPGLTEEKIQLIAYGSEGTISFENLEHLKIGRLGEPLQSVKVTETEYPSIIDTLVQEVFPTIVSHLAAAVQGRDAVLYPFQTGYNSQIVLEALRRPAGAGWADLRDLYNQ